MRTTREAFCPLRMVFTLYLVPLRDLSKLVETWKPMLTPLATLFVFAVIFMIAQRLTYRRERSKAKNYRFVYGDLLTQFERVTVKINHIGLMLEQTNDQTIAAYYEKCVSLFEQLLEMVTRVPRFNLDPVSIQAASHLASQCEERVDRTLISLLGIRSGHAVDKPFLFGMVKDRMRSLQGCFFCTRPFRPRDFGLTKTRIKGVKLLVVACTICQKRLAEQKKADVVFLNINGETVHWSQHPEFQGGAKYWGINGPNSSANGKTDGLTTKTIELFD